MKKILVVVGGGRPNGNTNQLADAFIKALPPDYVPLQAFPKDIDNLILFQHFVASIHNQRAVRQPL